MIFKILMVEDDINLVDSFKILIDVLPNLSLVAHTASQSDALSLISMHQPDILVVDLMLAEGDGISLLNDIAYEKVQRPRHIVVTTLATNSDIHQALLKTADFVLTKDITYNASNLVSYLESVYFSRVDEIAKRNQKLKSSISDYLNQFNLEKIKKDKLNLFKILLFETYLNHLSPAPLSLKKLHTELDKKYTGHSFHSNSISRIIDDILDATPINTLHEISTEFTKQKDKNLLQLESVSEKLFTKIMIESLPDSFRI